MQGTAPLTAQGLGSSIGCSVQAKAAGLGIVAAIILAEQCAFTATGLGSVTVEGIACSEHLCSSLGLCCCRE